MEKGERGRCIANVLRSTWTRTLRSHLSSSLLFFLPSLPPSRPLVGRPLLLDAFSFLLFFFSFRSRPPSLLVSLLSPLCAEGRDFFSIGHVGARAFHFFPFAVNFLCARPRFCPAAPLPLNSSFGDISSCLSAVMAATSSASLFRRNRILSSSTTNASFSVALFIVASIRVFNRDELVPNAEEYIPYDLMFYRVV